MRFLKFRASQRLLCAGIHTIPTLGLGGSGESMVDLEEELFERIG
jgi:hypothetical protein